MMDSSPRIFRSITQFAVSSVETKNPRLGCITTLTITFESKTPHGEYSLVLIKPLPPYSRSRAELSHLKALSKQDVDLIYEWPCDEHNQKGARIEVFPRNHDDGAITVRCERIECIVGLGKAEARVQSGVAQ